MCGIVGFSGKVTGSKLPMMNSLAEIGHRGPDAEGIYTSADIKVFLGHTRLSILDLSSNGAQPMISAETGNVLIYNGEIYNCESLKANQEAT